jgi:two-component system nitrogen regulation response regulator GlnG
MPRILVIDDEPNVLYSLQKGLQSGNLPVDGCQSAKQGIERVKQQKYDVVILDVRLPDMSGLDAFARIQEIDPRLPVIIVTAFATTETAIEAMKRGAYDYLIKPLNIFKLRELADKAIEVSRLRHVPAVYEETESGDESVDRIVGSSAAMQEAFKSIGRAAAQDVTVLILGESGTGKELVARALYHHSHRKEGPFLALNCAALHETLLESELFGHERGAFTGADRRRIGKFEQAQKGTIFLDEIGDMNPVTQGKVLRLLQEKQFERLGGNETIGADVRIIAATNKDLRTLVATGRFREDLFYRLNVFVIRLPALRDRPGDLPLLVNHFIKIYDRELNKKVLSVAPEVLERLEQHSWPGNVRELQNTIKQALLHSTGEILTLDSLPESFLAVSGTGPTSLPAPPSESLGIAERVTRLLEAGESDIYRKICLEVDRVVLDTALRHSRGSQVKASELLGIARTTLRAKLRALGMAIEKQLLSEQEAKSGE